MEKKNAYILAGFMSIVLYLIGVISGFLIQGSITNRIEANLISLRRNMENIQLKYMYLSTMGKTLSCDFLTSMVDKTNRDTWEVGRELTKLEEDESSKKFMDLKRDYSLLSVRAWILNSYVKEKCGEDEVILYFYSRNSPACREQGQILDELKAELKPKRILVFVLDYDLDEPIIQTLKEIYAIEKTPSLVIRNLTYVGIVPKAELEKILLSS